MNIGSKDGPRTVLVSPKDRPLLHVATWTVTVRDRLFNRKYDMCLYRMIMDPEDGEHVDHINHNPLDCRRENLRVCLEIQNQWNRRRRRTNRCGMKGVRAVRARWRAEITAHGRKYHLGTYDVLEEAARAYDRAAMHHHGEFAALNFP